MEEPQDNEVFNQNLHESDIHLWNRLCMKALANNEVEPEYIEMYINSAMTYCLHSDDPENMETLLGILATSPNKKIREYTKEVVADALPTFIHSVYDVNLSPDEFKKLTPYQLYLKSNHWQEFRKEALEFAHYKCQACSSTKLLQVHHNNYNCLWCEELSDVIVLCEKCHKKFHNKD